MTIQQFTEKYRLKVTRDSCGESIVLGRLYKDANISEHDAGKLCMCWLTKESHQKKFNSVKAACLSAGMTIAQEGDDEAIFLFDGANDQQAKLAIQSVRARVRRQLAPEQLARQVACLSKHRFSTQETAQKTT